MRESNIIYENGDFWVLRTPDAYHVMRPDAETRALSGSDSAYAKTDDGLSIAKARCDYLAKTHKGNMA